jgi:hypothetical protein
MYLAQNATSFTSKMPETLASAWIDMVLLSNGVALRLGVNTQSLRFEASNANLTFDF